MVAGVHHQGSNANSGSNFGALLRNNQTEVNIFHPYLNKSNELHSKSTEQKIIMSNNSGIIPASQS